MFYLKERLTLIAFIVFGPYARNRESQKDGFVIKESRFSINMSFTELSMSFLNSCIDKL